MPETDREFTPGELSIEAADVIISLPLKMIICQLYIPILNP